MTASLEALPTGTELTDKNGQRWKLGALQTRDSQVILYEGTLHPCAQGLGGAFSENGMEACTLTTERL